MEKYDLIHERALKLVQSLSKNMNMKSSVSNHYLDLKALAKREEKEKSSRFCLDRMRVNLMGKPKFVFNFRFKKF
jgi:hypothetical protein